MFTHLKRAYESLEDKSEIDPTTIEFCGFDGNNDKQVGYCHYLKQNEQYLNLNLDMNSHSEAALPMYRRMLVAYQRDGHRPELTKDEIQRVTDARQP